MYALQARFRITLQLESHCLSHPVSPIATVPTSSSTIGSIITAS